jgi:hypothetical protein
MNKQNQWIHSAKIDTIFILFPPFFSVTLGILLVIFFPNTTPEWSWLVFVLFIDVAHVYSTLFKTYFDSYNFRKHFKLYTIIPLICYLFFVGIYFWAGSLWFWRVLAYLAVFHFIRQQYGFLRIYNSKTSQSIWLNKTDETVIYLSTILPVLHWHLSGQKNFNWFVKGDFLQHYNASFAFFTICIFLGIVAVYLVKEMYLYTQNQFSYPRFLLIFGTMASWFVGVILFNNDLVFMILNVVAHGIPYMALVWIDIHRRRNKIGGFSRIVLLKNGWILFLLIIILLAFTEEGLWNAIHWREHGSYFSFFYQIPQQFSFDKLAFLLPLLALPQITHYVLDGFIWKKGFEN